MYFPFKVTVKFERCFYLSIRNSFTMHWIPLNLYIPGKLIKFSTEKIVQITFLFFLYQWHRALCLLQNFSPSRSSKSVRLWAKLSFFIFSSSQLDCQNGVSDFWYTSSFTVYSRFLNFDTCEGVFLTNHPIKKSKLSFKISWLCFEAQILYHRCAKFGNNRTKPVRVGTFFTALFGE